MKNQEEKVTPMMKQYLEIKNNHPDKIVMFRLGDFYEMFMEDAQKASKILQLTLTKRHDIPMCGIPHHASPNYFYKIIKAGLKIAIAEQIEKPGENGGGILKRAVNRIITPGTVIEEGNLSNDKNNYLLSFYSDIISSTLTVCACDVSTGYSEVFSLTAVDHEKEILELVNFYDSNEILISNFDLNIQKNGLIVNKIPSFAFDPSFSLKQIKEVFKINDPKAIDGGLIQDLQPVLSGLIYYIKENYQSALTHFQLPKLIQFENYMKLDEMTISNLELIKNNENKGTENTLLFILNKTKTPMGARLLREIILKPLLKLDEINNRLELVDRFFHQTLALNSLRKSFEYIQDMERITSKLGFLKITPKDLINLASSIEHSLSALDIVEEVIGTPSLKKEIKSALSKIKNLIDLSIVETPSNILKEGGYIQPSYNKKLHDYIEIKNKSEDLILDILEKEKTLSNINSLKIKYTDNSGYFFEVTKSNLKNVPTHFIKKQTMINMERFTTPELISSQEKIIEARTNSNQLEENLFWEVIDIINSDLLNIQLLSQKIAYFDVLSTFSQISLENNYSKPEVHDGFELKIIEGRHPIIENNLEKSFIANDISFQPTNNFIHLITGPNMAGKSTFLRQNALIILMSQIGCFVPAKKAILGITDRIFTRIGASDNLSKGLSTFLVEMTETAIILNQATSRSFIIMDEIGRGTSTYDGMALAWAILNHIYLSDHLKSKTLFATHYHELTSMDKNKGIVNYNMLVDEENGKLIFYNKVGNGPADKSYGIHVAEMAGLPHSLIKAAKNKLEEMEKEPKPRPINSKKKNEKIISDQNVGNEIINKLMEIDINNITPFEAIHILQDLKDQSKSASGDLNLPRK